MGSKSRKIRTGVFTGSFKKIRNLRFNLQIPIEIDGGINEKTIIDAKKEGAERFVATSFIFKVADPMQSFEKLLSLS